MYTTHPGLAVEIARERRQELLKLAAPSFSPSSTLIRRTLSFAGMILISFGTWIEGNTASSAMVREPR